MTSGRPRQTLVDNQGDIVGDKSPKQQNRNAQQKKSDKSAKTDARKARTPQAAAGLPAKGAKK